MRISEIEMDIMNAPQGYYLVHGISKDLNFKIGMPSVFDRVFRLKEKIENAIKYDELDIDLGEVVLIGNVFSLVVKDTSYDAPDRDNLLDALTDLRDNMEYYCIHKIAMPKICCGRGGLDWDDVKNMLEFVFDDYDCQILVCVQ